MATGRTLKRRLVYLALPYIDKSVRVMEMRFQAANLAAGYLFDLGYKVFSPISQSVPIVRECKLPNDFAFWKEYDHIMLSYCHTLFVLRLDGWEESKGVKEEIKYAKRNKMKIRYLDMGDISG